MYSDKLKEILEEHRKWVRGDGGSRADLSGVDLSGADLSGVDLSGVDLSDADLYGANLSRADLSGADLSGVDLSSADLSGANLQKRNYSVINILRSFWLLTPDAKHLTLELMAHDAESCGIEAMDKWAQGGDCPFINSERDYYFQEDRQLWLSASPADKIPKLRGRKLLEALAEATAVKL